MMQILFLLSLAGSELLRISPAGSPVSGNLCSETVRKLARGLLERATWVVEYGEMGLLGSVLQSGRASIRSSSGLFRQFRRNCLKKGLE